MRVRFRYSKLGKIRFAGHRDLARAWERALRRAELPVAWTSGFQPRPKVAFGLALSTGHEGIAEYLDVELVPDADVDVAVLPSALSPLLPNGVDCLASGVVAAGTPSLQEDVSSCRWELAVEGPDAEAAADAVAAFLAADHVEVRRSRKGTESVDDIRRDVLHLSVEASGGPTTTLVAELVAEGRALRPGELVTGCFAGRDAAVLRRALRTHQWIERGGARREPLPLDATPDWLALERAGEKGSR